MYNRKHTYAVDLADLVDILHPFRGLDLSHDNDCVIGDFDVICRGGKTVGETGKRGPLASDAPRREFRHLHDRSGLFSGTYHWDEDGARHFGVSLTLMENVISYAVPPKLTKYRGAEGDSLTGYRCRERV